MNSKTLFIARFSEANSARSPKTLTQAVLLPSLYLALFLALAGLGIGGVSLMGASDHAIDAIYRVSGAIFLLTLMIAWGVRYWLYAARIRP